MALSRESRKSTEHNAQMGTVQLFDTAEQELHRHDEVIKQQGLAQLTEMNYWPDGSCIMYEDSAVVAAVGGELKCLAVEPAVLSQLFQSLT